MASVFNCLQPALRLCELLVALAHLLLEVPLDLLGMYCWTVAGSMAAAGRADDGLSANADGS